MAGAGSRKCYKKKRQTDTHDKQTNRHTYCTAETDKQTQVVVCRKQIDTHTANRNRRTADHERLTPDRESNQQTEIDKITDRT